MNVLERKGELARAFDWAQETVSQGMGGCNRNPAHIIGREKRRRGKPASLDWAKRRAVRPRTPDWLTVSRAPLTPTAFSTRSAPGSPRVAVEPVWCKGVHRGLAGFPTRPDVDPGVVRSFSTVSEDQWAAGEGSGRRAANEGLRHQVPSERRRTRKCGKTSVAPGSVMLPRPWEVMVPGQLRYRVKTDVYVSLIPAAR